MELALIRTLMDKEFYDNNKSLVKKDGLFSKDVRKIKQTLDYAMTTYERSLTTSELEALFFANNSTMTTANKQVYNELFKRVSREEAMNKEIASEVLSKLCQQLLGGEFAQLGFEMANGTMNSLEPVRQLLQAHRDDFTPNHTLEFGNMDIDHLLKANDIQSQWKFNIPSLRRDVEGISGGHFIIVGARPNTGKTSFHASLIGAPNGFASQGAKCLVLCNEEAYERVGARYLSAATSLSMEEVKGNYALAASRYEPVRKQIELYDSTGKDMGWVEAIIKAYKPDIVVLDMGDKFAVKNSDKSDVYLKNAAIHARNIAKQYDCAIIWMSQLSADAEGKINVDQSMLEGSKTGKAAEADLMVLISKNPVLDVSNDDADDSQRYLIIAKNKLKGGWHGKITCELDGARAQYLA